MQTFQEELRYQYPLTSDCLIFDVGAHEGKWTRLMCEKYDCLAIAFEPIREFYELTKKNLAPHPKATVVNIGLGRDNRREEWGVHGDQTGILSTGEQKEVVQIRAISDVMSELGVGIVFPKISVLKLNVEASEFELLESLLDNQLVQYFAHIQCQPHRIVPDADARWEAICERMKATHRVTFHAPWCWIGWEALP